MYSQTLYCIQSFYITTVESIFLRRLVVVVAVVVVSLPIRGVVSTIVTYNFWGVGGSKL